MLFAQLHIFFINWIKFLICKLAGSFQNITQIEEKSLSPLNLLPWPTSRALSPSSEALPWPGHFWPMIGQLVTRGAGASRLATRAELSLVRERWGGSGLAIYLASRQALFDYPLSSAPGICSRHQAPTLLYSLHCIWLFLRFGNVLRLFLNLYNFRDKFKVKEVEIS